eukprot:TRINITY_DN81522_c0_g1_i1.p1 TRINITY_DN81522_c0_g1~~TRINITY_DN81522_c0_g1_i1.p1  ORF type:complete len:378 (+),score=90.15 TRINITY_DN81522_c0_g1_i1:163-1134(+)
MMSHSCSPSAAWHLDDSNCMIIHARRAMEEGEEVTISYLSPADLCLPTPDRQQLLFSAKGFLCSCSRCKEPQDAARAFRCPRCGCCEAFALMEPWQPESESGGGASSSAAARSPRDGALVCRACGALTAAEAAPLLAGEASFRRWARLRPEFQTLGKDAEDADTSGAEVSACSLLREAEEAGLADRHWIVDAMCDAAASEKPTRAVELLRRRLVVHEEGSGHCMTKRSRLQIALAEALCAEGSQAALREAAAVYGDAAGCLGVLFGDDHPEHLDAACSQEMAERKLASLAVAPPRGGYACAGASPPEGRQRKRGVIPSGKKRR